MRRGLWVAIAVVVVVVLAGLLVFGSYVTAKNQMVAKQEAVHEEWSQVDVVLQRRADLIPNLVATVKGYAQHEETVFGDVDKAREALLGAHDPQSKIQANGQLDGALGRLLAISENYPNLKADQNFLALQDQLEGSENRIAVERRRYNETLRDYNTFIRQFPNSIWAGVAGFQPDNAYFQASEGSRQAPQVKF
ncbi:LemA family protein [Acidipila sp. 4G-K13]|uniref:LemA family protein n=2 Tax=Paracidobacterium acidisoli TaxID=2303751 RepID=A0A372IST6_9BACT|nr:LemA family protein [Paracidobacterium acidisoli]MBT9330378.1 LemA family protein [Paracidobacterium acidisoli]